MPLRRRDGGDAPDPPRFTVGQAAELACREPAPFGGDAAARAARTAAVLGRLVQALHDEGTPDDAAVPQIVGDMFGAADAPDTSGGDTEGVG